MADSENKELEQALSDSKTKDASNDSSKVNDNDPLIPDEILEAIPVEERSKVISVIKQSMISSVTRRNNPIADKITTEHITQLISKSDEQDKRDREERKGQRSYNLILLLIGLAFIGFLVVFLQRDKELLIKIIVAIISFVGGFGLGKSTTKKEE